MVRAEQREIQKEKRAKTNCGRYIHIYAEMWYMRANYGTMQHATAYKYI